jgi:Adenylate and Guanylate cyclase catalytic domain
VLVAVLFTDIVGSSEIASGLGDERWGRLLARHHATVRAALRRFNGREMDTAGDGFFAVFDRPGDAMRCAWALVEELRGLGLEIRAGVHVGEAEVAGAKVGGVAVNVGARVMSAAGPGEVLVTGTVRELSAGAGFAFDDRGVQQLKGIPGEWRLHSVTGLDGVSPRGRLDPAVAEERRTVASARADRDRRPLVLGMVIGAVLAIVAIAVLALRGDTPGMPTPSAPAFPDEAESELLGLVPMGIRSFCERGPREPASARAALSCEDEEQSITYALMPDQGTLEAAHGRLLAERDIAGGDCGTDLEAENDYSIAGERAGRVLCYREEEGNSASSVMAWTDDRYLVLSVASRPDLADLTLLRWWATEAGPDPRERPMDKDLTLAPIIDGSFRLVIRPDEVGQVYADLAGTWVIAIDNDRLQANKESGPETPPMGGRIAFGKDRRLVVLDYNSRRGSVGGGCQTTLDLRWDLVAGRLRLTYLDRGCTFDAPRALLTFGPMERIG